MMFVCTVSNFLDVFFLGFGLGIFIVFIALYIYLKFGGK
jgi:hypothetical protein